MRKPKPKQAIFFYEDDGEHLVMNYSNIGDNERRDGVKPVSTFLKEQRGVTLEKEERGHGHTRRWVCRVTDRDRLEQAARAAGIKVL